jgi:predicted metal-dependent hydrolase
MIDAGYKIDTDVLKLDFITGTRPAYYLQARPGEVHIVCPPDASFDGPTRQAWFRRVIKEALRRQAKAYLPKRISTLAAQHGFNFERVSVNSATTRWGSCSARRSINLSLYLMTLPSKYIDYVLLHELCHLREMNHGPRFWALLDSLTDNQARTLRNEMKTFHTGIR